MECLIERVRTAAVAQPSKGKQSGINISYHLSDISYSTRDLGMSTFTMPFKHSFRVHYFRLLVSDLYKLIGTYTYLIINIVILLNCYG